MKIRTRSLAALQGGRLNKWEKAVEHGAHLIGRYYYNSDGDYLGELGRRALQADGAIQELANIVQSLSQARLHDTEWDRLRKKYSDHPDAYKLDVGGHTPMSPLRRALASLLLDVEYELSTREMYSGFRQNYEVGSLA